MYVSAEGELSTIKHLFVLSVWYQRRILCMYIFSSVLSYVVYSLYLAMSHSQVRSSVINTAVCHVSYATEQRVESAHIPSAAPLHQIYKPLYI